MYLFIILFSLSLTSNYHHRDRKDTYDTCARQKLETVAAVLLNLLHTQLQTTVANKSSKLTLQATVLCSSLHLAHLRVLLFSLSLESTRHLFKRISRVADQVCCFLMRYLISSALVDEDSPDE